MTRGRLGAYLAFHLKDFLLLRAGLPTVMVVMLGAMVLNVGAPGDNWDTPQGHRVAAEMFRAFAGIFITLGAFLGVTRLVAEDRSMGYFRFYFSKPISVERFYVQQWVLHGVGLVLLVGALAATLRALTVPTVPVGGAMAVMALTWLLVGGIGFVITVVVNADAAVLVLVYVTTIVLRSLRDVPQSPLPAWLSQLTRALPPTQKLEYVRDALYAGAGVPWGHAAHVVGYGVAAFVLAVVLLRRMSLAR